VNKKLYFFENAITYEYIYKALSDLGITKYNLLEKEFYSKFMVIDNNAGYHNTLKKLNKSEAHIIFSNCVYLLGRDCFYNEDTQKWDIFIWKGKKHFVTIQDLTDKELRRAHSIERMYRNGAFDD
jgi:hypothetical protein